MLLAISQASFGLLTQLRPASLGLFSRFQTSITRLTQSAKAHTLLTASHCWTHEVPAGQ